MKKIIFKGCGTAIITPFDKNGVNFDEFKKLIEFQISEGADALIVCGTTGEASTMTLDERKETIKFAVKVANKRIPIIAGTGSNCTQSAIEFTKWAETAGVDGCLVVTPYYNKTTQEGLIAHYKAIAESTLLPIILYSVPSRTGVNILPQTCLELSKIPNIVAIKEASGNLSQIAEIKSLCRENLHIYSGNDDQIVPILSLGGIGVISVLSNIAPKFTHDMVYNYFEGKQVEAADMQLDSFYLIKALFAEVNPIPVKAALNMLGYNVGTPRLPLIEMTEKGKNKLKEELKNFNLI
ncbi:MAG: 4-hydroxy-tetrahydrodipicolinate synthase [Clostridia bacterium]|jgi:4-hydroxy-tetrahydrodipicolinate synthase|nr:4-hydroxy-tetrahydrodipicolinate synthase [Clostridia bacterium]